MIRAFTLISFLACTASAMAEPWEKHPLLSFPATPLAVADPDEKFGTTDAGATKPFFDAHALRGIPCDAVDGRKRRVTITCADEQRQETTVYQGEFFGAGTFLVETVAINGRLLTDAERVALVLSVRQPK